MATPLTFESLTRERDTQFSSSNVLNEASSFSLAKSLLLTLTLLPMAGATKLNKLVRVVNQDLIVAPTLENEILTLRDLYMCARAQKHVTHINQIIASDIVVALWLNVFLVRR